jgi:hypothetical protein
MGEEGGFQDGRSSLRSVEHPAFDICALHGLLEELALRANRLLSGDGFLSWAQAWINATVTLSRLLDVCAGLTRGLLAAAAGLPVAKLFSYVRMLT